MFKKFILVLFVLGLIPSICLAGLNEESYRRSEETKSAGKKVAGALGVAAIAALMMERDHQVKGTHSYDGNSNFDENVESAVRPRSEVSLYYTGREAAKVELRRRANQASRDARDLEMYSSIEAGLAIGNAYNASVSDDRDTYSIDSMLAVNNAVGAATGFSQARGLAEESKRLTKSRVQIQKGGPFNHIEVVKSFDVGPTPEHVKETVSSIKSFANDVRKDPTASFRAIRSTPRIKLAVAATLGVAAVGTWAVSQWVGDGWLQNSKDLQANAAVENSNWAERASLRPAKVHTGLYSSIPHSGPHSSPNSGPQFPANTSTSVSEAR